MVMASEILFPPQARAALTPTSVLTSNRNPPTNRLAVVAEPLLAQSAVDRLTSTAHELVIEGQSCHRRQKLIS